MSFQNSSTIELGLSDYHKMTVTVMKHYFPKLTSSRIRYRNFKQFNNVSFRKKVIPELESLGENISLFMKHLNEMAPMKEKYVRANNAQFINKVLGKAIMNRSRLRNRFLRNPNRINENNYKRQENFVVNLMRREKKRYYENIDPRNISDNKKFWKTITRRSFHGSLIFQKK